MKVYHVVSAIIRHEDKILMIQQPDDEGLYWFIPGGVMEPGELITETLRREVREETGLIVDGSDAKLAYVAHIDAAHEARQTVAFVFDVSLFSGELLPDDPDKLIHDAVFVPVEEAVQRLQRVTWASMREPLMAYLCGESSAGSVWQYRQHAERRFELVYRTS